VFEDGELNPDSVVAFFATTIKGMYINFSQSAKEESKSPNGIAVFHLPPFGYKYP